MIAKERMGSISIRTNCDLKSLGLWVLLISIVIALLLACAWCRIQCRRIGYELSQETSTYQQLTAIQNTLRIELERLKSPERIARIARNQLDLVTPAPHQKKNIPVHDSR